MLYLDLNKFKQVNDHHGHGVGDLLLQAFASRLTQHTREADTVARMGGDEFVVLLENSPSEADTAVVVANIRAAMQAPVELAGLSLAVQPSIGIAYFPTHGHDEASLLNHADASMYGEKSSQAAGEQPSAATREGVVVEPSSDAQDV